jgi:FixJ family two-component response regulator
MTSNSTPPRVAVVDDEESICRALMRLLRAAGFDAATYTSGAQFLESLRHGQRPDCVIADIHMPGVSGFDLQASVSRIQPPIPVIAMTGRHRDETRQAMLLAGAVAYLQKPIDERTLIDAVTAAISRNRSGAGRAVISA